MKKIILTAVIAMLILKTQGMDDNIKNPLEYNPENHISHEVNEEIEEDFTFPYSEMYERLEERDERLKERHERLEKRLKERYERLGEMDEMYKRLEKMKISLKRREEKNDTRQLHSEYKPVNILHEMNEEIGEDFTFPYSEMYERLEERYERLGEMYERLEERYERLGEMYEMYERLEKMKISLKRREEKNDTRQLHSEYKPVNILHEMNEEIGEDFTFPYSEMYKRLEKMKISLKRSEEENDTRQLHSEYKPENNILHEMNEEIEEDFTFPYSEMYKRLKKIEPINIGKIIEDFNKSINFDDFIIKKN